MKRKYVTRYVYANGKWTEKKLLWADVVKRIEERLRKDREMLEILKKL